MTAEERAELVWTLARAIAGAYGHNVAVGVNEAFYDFARKFLACHEAMQTLKSDKP